jgi:hypothetical protein
MPQVDLDPQLLSTERQQPSRDGADPYMARSELRVAGFDEPATAAAPLAAAEGSAPAAPVTVDALREGSWYDLHARGEWRRAQLTWASSRGTLFMFVSSGGRPHSMTLRTLERLLAERLLRPVEAGPVVQRAIDALSQRRAGAEPLAA